jgi:tRNA pseudouridine38-40 synthase
MRTVRLTLVYDGTDFSGFQAQVGRRTVQQTVEEAIERVTGVFARIVGAGRTDAGVHAAGQVVSFRTESDLPIATLASAIDAQLPADVGIVDAATVDADFHARYSARGRAYRYSISNSGERPILDRRFVYHWRARLDETRMHEVAQEFAGHHDFLAFCGTLRGRDRPTSTKRTIFQIKCWRDGDRILIDTAADGFLPRMVRNVTGTLIRVGMNQVDGAAVRAMLNGTRPRVPSVTAPAQGLCLTRVWYDTPSPSA